MPSAVAHISEQPLTKGQFADQDQPIATDVQPFELAEWRSLGS